MTVLDPDRLARGDDGQDLVEYSLLVGFVAMVVLAGVTLLGTALNDFWARIASGIGHL